MKNEKIMDAVRMLRQMCAEQTDCVHCDFGRDNRTCKISGIPAQWFDDDEHPACTKTRQERFLEMFPHADTYTGALNICPGDIDVRYTCHGPKDCADCKKEYWLAAEEEEKS